MKVNNAGKIKTGSVMQTLSRIVGSPMKVFLFAVVLYMVIQGVNVVINAAGIESALLTGILDGILQFGNVGLGILFVLVLSIYFYNRMRS